MVIILEENNQKWPVISKENVLILVINYDGGWSACHLDDLVSAL